MTARGLHGEYSRTIFVMSDMGNLLRHILVSAILGALVAMGCASGGTDPLPEEAAAAQPTVQTPLSVTQGQVLPGQVQKSRVHRNVLLPPGPGNPRNSEGDFIQLDDGRVMFIYTRFTGGGRDQDEADLAARSLAWLS